MPMPRIPASVVLEVFDLHNKKLSLRKIAAVMGKSSSWVLHILKSRCPETGLMLNPAPYGSRRKTTQDEDDRIIEYYAANEKASLRQASAALGLSTSLIIRRLKEQGKKSSGDQEPNPLCVAHRNDRVNWCLYKRELLRENPGLFSKTIFSDETQFNMYNGRVVHWTLGKERKSNYNPSVDQGGVMVWGALSIHGPISILPLDTRLTGPTYSKILTENLLPYLDIHGRDMELQQKSRTAFTSSLMKRYFYDEGVSLINWPRNSADLNPIHVVWGLMEKYLNERDPRDVAELRQMIPEAWRMVCTKELCTRLYGSMGARLQKVIHNKGATRFEEVKSVPSVTRSSQKSKKAVDPPAGKVSSSVKNSKPPVTKPPKVTPTAARKKKKTAKSKKAKTPAARKRTMKDQTLLPIANLPVPEPALEESIESGYETVVLNLHDAWEMMVKEGRDLPESKQMEVLKQIGTILYDAKTEVLGQFPEHTTLGLISAGH